MLYCFNFFVVFFVVTSSVWSQTQTTGDDDRKYTNVGLLGLTVTNFGTVGTRNFYWNERQPSCEYPIGSRIEHIYQGGLWVGAVSRSTGQQHVSTGAHDRLFSSERGEFPMRPEFASERDSFITQRSSLSESPFFNERAISHQDFFATYSDLNTNNPTSGDTLFRHEPLGVEVRQQSYAWNFPFANSFVILNYTLYNVGTDTLDSVYVGFWCDPVVRNTNPGFVPPGTPGYFTQKAVGYMDSLRMGYGFDFTGNPGPTPANSYVGIKLLGATPFPRGVLLRDSLRNRTYFNSWVFRDDGGLVAYRSPQDDAEAVQNARSRFDRLARSLTPQEIAVLRLASPAGIAPGNFTILLSSGPFSFLEPGDSLNVVFGVVCARKFGTDPARYDSLQQRRTLITNAGFCQLAYDGEDVNGNNILDSGEDLNGNGTLDHYILPQPPRSPKVRVEVENQSVTVYWDKSTSELSVDPTSHEQDFEGYRVYRSNPGADFANPEDLLLTLSLVGEFDIPNNIGYNTGFSQILLPEPKIFPGDTVAYWYRFPPTGSGITHLNGWQYLYGVSAFDSGNVAIAIPSLESKTEIRRVVPGTPATSDPDKPVGVYPNPYYVGARWDGSGERNRKIYFYNLPALCEIRIYTLAGDIVAELYHDSNTYEGTDIEWFRRFGGSQIPPQFAGGEHAWDLITKFDQAISTGLYLFSVWDLATDEIKTGKFLVIK
jgi:hypothetical protein